MSAAAPASFVLPEIEDLGFTRIHMVNPNPDPATVTLELLRSDGTPRVAPVTRTINANGVVAEPFTALFPGIVPDATDYIRGSSNRGVVPFEYLGRELRYVEGLNGQDVAAGATTVYSAQYVVGGPDWQSMLSVINLDSAAGSVSLRFVSNEGTQIGHRKGCYPLRPGENPDHGSKVFHRCRRHVKARLPGDQQQRQTCRKRGFWRSRTEPLFFGASPGIESPEPAGAGPSRFQRHLFHRASLLSIRTMRRRGLSSRFTTVMATL